MINKTKIVVGAGLILSLAIAMLVFVPSANAYTENITSGPDLTIGSTGTGVIVLQGLLSEMGYLNVPAGIPLGYFGAMTKSALSRYQIAEGVTPTAGYFGTKTKIAMHQDFAPHGWLTLLGW